MVPPFQFVRFGDEDSDVHINFPDGCEEYFDIPARGLATMGDTGAGKSTALRSLTGANFNVGHLNGRVTKGAWAALTKSVSTGDMTITLDIEGLDSDDDAAVARAVFCLTVCLPFLHTILVPVKDTRVSTEAASKWIAPVAAIFR